jgi:hypothetical protein
MAGMAAVLAIVTGLMVQPATEAGVDAAAAGPAMTPSGITEFSAPEIRTLADIQATEAAHGAVRRARRVKVFLPTIPPAEYAARKSAATASSAGSAAAATEAAAPAPPMQFITFEGLSGAAAGGFAPSDSHGAVGHTQYVEVVNEALRVWTKATAFGAPGILATFSLPAFFNTLESVFDPRVIYDPLWQRWVVIGTRHSAHAGDTVKRIFLAVSRTNSATGSWCKYTVTFSGGMVENGDWWDFPQLGRDLDSVIVTGNIFTGTDAFRTSSLMSIPKARAYNCLSIAPPPRFEGLAGSPAPPILDGTTGSAYILAASGVGVLRYALTASSRTPGATLTGPTTVTGVPVWAVPPNATQPGTGTRLDTIDGRFQNASTQIGNHVWNIHTVGAGGFARLRWYRINGATSSVIATGIVTPAAGSEHDFNGAIAANNAQNVFVVYSASSTATRAQMRFTGKLLSEVTIPKGSTLLTSPFSFTGVSVARWGDYSAVSIDPALGTRAWIVNQYAAGPSQFDWGTRIAVIGN